MDIEDKHTSAIGVICSQALQQHCLQLCPVSPGSGTGCSFLPHRQHPRVGGTAPGRSPRARPPRLMGKPPRVEGCGAGRGAEGPTRPGSRRRAGGSGSADTPGLRAARGLLPAALGTRPRVCPRRLRAPRPRQRRARTAAERSAEPPLRPLPAGHGSASARHPRTLRGRGDSVTAPGAPALPAARSGSAHTGALPRPPGSPRSHTRARCLSFRLLP
ncbi:uncharacterized protein LOC120324218 [Pipra filicauda]|uniref:Uncharacterized protein LOC120324218 n=1 Tax=Pipra filicauda TaxID=649802 RepID=A0A7R5KY86_9PASS|nr:uncharacterized protein LOC120324218 [Pipra filicauda]